MRNKYEFKVSEMLKWENEMLIDKIEKLEKELAIAKFNLNNKDREVKELRIKYQIINELNL